MFVHQSNNQDQIEINKMYFFSDVMQSKNNSQNFICQIFLSKKSHSIFDKNRISEYN